MPLFSIAADNLVSSFAILNRSALTILVYKLPEDKNQMLTKGDDTVLVVLVFSLLTRENKVDLHVMYNVFKMITEMLLPILFATYCLISDKHFTKSVPNSWMR